MTSQPHRRCTMLKYLWASHWILCFRSSYYYFWTLVDLRPLFLVYYLSRLCLYLRHTALLIACIVLFYQLNIYVVERMEYYFCYMIGNISFFLSVNKKYLSEVFMHHLLNAFLIYPSMVRMWISFSDGTLIGSTYSY